MLEIDKIYLGDCLELMNEIADESIDCIICDKICISHLFTVFSYK